MVRLAIACLLLSACVDGSKPGTFGVNVTVNTAMVKNQVVTAALRVTGDEPFEREFDVSNTAPTGEVRFHYVPGIQSGTLFFAIDGLDASRKIVARGARNGVVLIPGMAVDAEFVLAGGNGEPCKDDSECPSAHCSDGVCCDSACKGVCESCNQAGKKGQCSPIAADTDPEMECPAKTPSEDGGGMVELDDAGQPVPTDGGLKEPDGGFKLDSTQCAGTCSGNRSCKFPGATTNCGTPFCNSTTDTGTFACDGTGACGAKIAMCTSFTCGEANGQCRTQCSISDQDCQSGFFCNSIGSCAPQKPNGQACSINAECSSKFCVGVGSPPSTTNKVCCNSDCTGGMGLQCNAGGMCTCSLPCGAAGCRLFYKDGDIDSFGDPDPAKAVVGCVGAAPPAGFVTDNTDCDDANKDAKPGQGLFFDVPRANGSYDYNCDKVETPGTSYPGAVCGVCKYQGIGKFQTCSGDTTCDAVGLKSALTCRVFFFPSQSCINSATSGYVNNPPVACGSNGTFVTCSTCATVGAPPTSSAILKKQICH